MIYWILFPLLTIVLVVAICAMIHENHKNNQWWADHPELERPPNGPGPCER